MRGVSIMAILKYQTTNSCKILAILCVNHKKIGFGKSFCNIWSNRKIILHFEKKRSVRNYKIASSVVLCSKCKEIIAKREKNEYTRKKYPFSLISN